MYPIPCKDCLIFPICKSRNTIISTLKCSYLGLWLISNRSSSALYERWNEIIRIFTYPSFTTILADDLTIKIRTSFKYRQYLEEKRNRECV